MSENNTIIQSEAEKAPSFRSAKGPIAYTLKNDLLFHYVMSRSNDALKGLICTLLFYA